jgi:hypothetical protein
LPPASGSPSSMGLSYHTTTITSLPIPGLSMVTASVGSSSPSSSSSPCPSYGTSTTTPRPPRLPQRPSFSRRQRFNLTYTQLASHMAVVQAQPHKPKRPSPLHISVSPESIDSELSSVSSSSEDESSPELRDRGGKLLSPITEEKEVGGLGNMLGLDLKGWSWSCERQERMKEPKTPFPSPAILF